jgi:hypothetical protein
MLLLLLGIEPRSWKKDVEEEEMGKNQKKEGEEKRDRRRCRKR